MDNRHDSNRQDSKDRFFDLISSAEEDLDIADQLGKSGNVEMISVLEEMEGINELIEKTASESGEIPPPKNYEHEINRLAKHYLPSIFRSESIRIKDSISNLGCLNNECQKQINRLQKIVNYYGEIYPELELEKYMVELDSVCREAPRSRKNFFARIFNIN